jgi:hypothetical protein
VYGTLECNKLPLWIEPANLLQYVNGAPYLQWKKETLPFVAVSSLHFRLLLSENFSNCVVGTCYRYYCPSLLSVLQLSVLPLTISTEFPTNHHSNTERHQRKSAVTQKRWRIRKESYLNFWCHQLISPRFLAYCTRALSHPVYGLINTFGQIITFFNDVLSTTCIRHI